MQYIEIKKDLFEMDSSYTLAHCISQDCAMGAGIAKEFRRRFPEMPDKVFLQNPQVGTAIPYDCGDRVIFNLITKPIWSDKPTYESFKKSIIDLKRKMADTDKKKLATPLLGAGLDGLDWSKNREIIQQVFADTDVEIVVCKL